ncbi:syntaxin-16-like [Xenia sp. Carnegie-2017]|uniref:syntaxin-16-like n=1 Tax=Xenia sp. Carnegie-2017 TaxID=2897299 RepID=UPI001F04CD17|nr:syntaxin-16-like [Xenia sp. Carnegie-2017]
MATNSHTEYFIRIRNEIQRFNNYARQNDFAVTDDDTVALVATSDVEFSGTSAISSLPPEWVDNVEEIQYEVTKIKQKMKQLSTMHDKHLNRPSLDDSADEEQTIEITTKEITQMFHQSQAAIHKIIAKSKSGNPEEKRLVKNVVSSLAASLQELSGNFRKSQSTYLKKMKNREERESQYFNRNIGSVGSSLLEDDNSELYDTGFSAQQVKLVDDNTALIQQREKEIQHIVSSIADLNQIFQDLSSLIVEQGTILDRIDYNVEQASVKVEEGLEQLKKGEKYQKSSRKMLIIILLAVIIVVLLISLVATKSK